jgi:hypothetical protein
VGIYNSLTDTWIWKLGLRPRYSFPGNICFKFSTFCLCSAQQTIRKECFVVYNIWGILNHPHFHVLDFLRILFLS